MAQRLDVKYVRYYTDGSAAQKLAPAQPFKTLKLPKLRQQKPKALYIDPIATAGIVVAAVMLVLLIVGAVQLVQARQDARQMEAYVQTLQKKNEELTTTYQSKYNLEKVRQTALSLGFVPKEQVTHITLTVPSEQEPENAGVLDRFYTFLTGLFA